MRGTTGAQEGRVTIARLFPDTPLKQAAFAAALLVGSYVAAGLVNASPVVQPRLSSHAPRGAVILVVPPSDVPDAAPSPAHLPVSLDHPHRSL